MSAEAASLRQILARIEYEFGVDWLMWRNSRGKQGGRRRTEKSHPLAVALCEIKGVLALVEGGGTPPAAAIASISLLDEVGIDLATAQNIPNFDKAVRPRLKTGEFEKAHFEMNVGSVYHRSGQRVEFIAPTGKGRMADLKVIVEDQDVFVECTRKDAYQPDRDDDQASRVALANRTVALQEELASSLETIAIVSGTLDERGSEALLAGLRQAIASGQRGTRVRAAQGLGFIVRELTTVARPPGGGAGPALPAALLSPRRAAAISQGTYGMDENGQPVLTNEKRASVYGIDAHRMSAVSDALQRKIGQIPKDASGVVYLNLDVSHVLEQDLDFYLGMACGVVHAALATPPGKPQIGAIVLVTTPVLVPVAGQAEERRVPARRCYMVKNPEGTLPSGFVVPGSERDHPPVSDTKGTD